jgi:hypothetical protein
VLYGCWVRGPVHGYRGQLFGGVRWLLCLESVCLGRRREGLHVVDGCPQPVLYRADIPSDPSEEHAALLSGKQQIGQPGGIRVSTDAAEWLHPLKAVTEDAPPLIERACEFIVNVKVCPDDPARKGAGAAPVPVGTLVGDVVISPDLSGVNCGKKWASKPKGSALGHNEDSPEAVRTGQGSTLTTHTRTGG